MALLNVAVVGTNGFIGKHLVNCLLLNKNIHLSLFGKSASSIFPNYLPINLTDTAFINAHFKNIDYIYYLASETIPSNSWNDPFIEIEKNLKPFLSFLEAISKLNVKKIGFISSAGTIYGQSTNSAFENGNKEPFSPYGIMKLTMENFLNYYHHKYGLCFDIFRVSNVYGEGQDTSKGLGLINTMLEKIITEKQISIFGDGENLRNYIYVKDLAMILNNMLKTDLKTNYILNIASNDTLSINQIIELVKKHVTNDFKIIHEKERGSDNKRIEIDNSKLKKLMPDFNFTSIETGIKQTFEFIKANKN